MREEKKYFCVELTQCGSVTFASSCAVLEIRCRQLSSDSLEKNARRKRQKTRIPDSVTSVLGNSLAASHHRGLAGNADIANSSYVITHKIQSMNAESSSVLHKRLLPQSTRVYD